MCPADIQLQNSTRDGKEIVVGEGSSISVKHIEDTEGNKFLMAFTDWKELYKWNSSKEQQTVILVIRISEHHEGSERCIFRNCNKSFWCKYCDYASNA